MTNRNGRRSPGFTTASWTTLSASAYAWATLHQGGWFEPVTGLYLFRHRDYSPTLARWLEVDPIGFGAGDVSYYRFVDDAPVSDTDPQGTKPSIARCAYLARKIENIRVQIIKRVEEFKANPLNLPWTCEGDDVKPSLSRKGHQAIIAGLKAQLAVLSAEYFRDCI